VARSEGLEPPNLLIRSYFNDPNTLLELPDKLAWFIRGSLQKSADFRSGCGTSLLYGYQLGNWLVMCTPTTTSQVNGSSARVRCHQF
jgi:hypothetical protein